MNRLKHRFSIWLRTKRLGLHSPLRRKRGKQPANGGCLTLLGVTLLTFFVLLFFVNRHLRPTMIQVARVTVDQHASRVINDAITRRISEEEVSYGNLVFFEKDLQGRITALETNIVAINRLKVGITEDVLAELEKTDTSRLSIPLGNLLGSDFLSGRGPGIGFRIVPLGTVETSFSNEFTAAGINQTRHQIMINLTIDISVLLPGYTDSTQVTTQVCIAETVIVGEVPDRYFSAGDLFGWGN